jgi:hypothetical protein
MEPAVMTNTAPTVDAIAQLCFEQVCDEVQEIMGGEEYIGLEDCTPCELIALLAIVRPVWERTRLARRQPAPVLTLVPRAVRNRKRAARV